MLFIALAVFNMFCRSASVSNVRSWYPRGQFAKGLRKCNARKLAGRRARGCVSTRIGQHAPSERGPPLYLHKPGSKSSEKANPGG